jgi:amphi-Trp domain-containing protein
MNKFNLEQEKSRTEVAAYLRQLADGLEDGEKVTLISGEQSVTINPPESLHFKIETDTDSSWLGSENGQSVELELGWEAKAVEGDDDLVIVQQPNAHQRTEATQGDSHQQQTGSHETRHDDTTHQ